MGLAERRKIKELSETTLPEREREIQEICGANVKYDVDWATLADNAEALNFLDNISCHRLNMALRVIATDDLGKEALQDALKSVKLRNVRTREDMAISFSDGVLEMSCAYALRTEGMFTDGEIRNVLMKAL